MEIETDATVLPTSVTLDNAGAATCRRVPRQVGDRHRSRTSCTAGSEGATAGLLQGCQRPWHGVSELLSLGWNINIK